MATAGKILAALVLAVLLAAAPVAQAQDDKLNIWIVVHSHDDVGWLVYPVVVLFF